MMVSWHNWKLKLKRYWFSVWCWWSKWKDASWSQCDFPGRSTEDPGRSKSGVAAPQDIWRSAPCAPRLALSRMVSPPPPTMRQKTVRFFHLPNIVIETISMIVLQGSWRCPEPQGCAWEDRECFPHRRAEDRQEGARGSGQKRSEMGFLDLE